MKYEAISTLDQTPEGEMKLLLIDFIKGIPNNSGHFAKYTSIKDIARYCALGLIAKKVFPLNIIWYIDNTPNAENYFLNIYNKISDLLDLLIVTEKVSIQDTTNNHFRLVIK